MSQRDRAEARTEKAHKLSKGLQRTPSHRAVVKGRRVAKKHAARAQRRVDSATVREAYGHDPDADADDDGLLADLEDVEPVGPLKAQYVNGFVAGKAAVRADLRKVVIAHYGSLHRAGAYGFGVKLLALLKVES